MNTHVLIRIYPDIPTIPSERTENLSFFMCCLAAYIQDAECIVRMACEDDVIECFISSFTRPESLRPESHLAFA